MAEHKDTLSSNELKELTIQNTYNDLINTLSPKMLNEPRIPPLLQNEKLNQDMILFIKAVTTRPTRRALPQFHGRTQQ